MPTLRWRLIPACLNRNEDLSQIAVAGQITQSLQFDCHCGPMLRKTAKYMHWISMRCVLPHVAGLPQWQDGVNIHIAKDVLLDDVTSVAGSNCQNSQAQRSFRKTKSDI